MRQLLGGIARFVRDSGVEALFTLAIIARLLSPVMPTVHVAPAPPDHASFRATYAPAGGEARVMVAVAPELRAEVAPTVVLRDVLARENARLARERARAARQAAVNARARAAAVRAATQAAMHAADCDSSVRVTVVAPDGRISYKYVKGGAT